MSCAPTICPPSTIPSPQPALTITPPVGNMCGVTTIYYNTQQQYVDSCPVGSPTAPITVIVPAFTFSSSVDQSTADNLALTFAQSQAAALRILTPCQSTPSGDFLLGDGGDFLLGDGGDFLTT